MGQIRDFLRFTFFLLLFGSLAPNGTNSGLFKIFFFCFFLVLYDPKWDKSGTFSDQISVHFGSVSQNVLKSDLKKSQICPIWGLKNQFEVNSIIPEVTRVWNTGLVYWSYVLLIWVLLTGLGTGLLYWFWLFHPPVDIECSLVVQFTCWLTRASCDSSTDSSYWSCLIDLLIHLTWSPRSLFGVVLYRVERWSNQHSSK